MKTELILVGKTTERLYAEGIDDYAKRINHYVPFGINTIAALKNTRNYTQAQQKQEEGKLILKQIQPSDIVVLLDEHGTERTSMGMAEWLQKKMQGARKVVFVIGGPYGFSEEVYARADEKISLSKMTFSHQMVRLVFTEQLYRACTIIKGESYHHE